MKMTRWMWVAVLPLVACGPAQDWSEAEGADEVEFAQSEAELVLEETATAEDGSARCADLTPEQLADRAAQNASKRFSPASCVTATANGATVTYVLDHCTGPRGRAEVTGTMNVVFSEKNGDITVTANGKGLKLRRGTIDLDATATCQLQADGKRLWTAASTSTGTTLRGDAISHQGNWTLLVDRATKCAELDGAWSHTAGARQRTTTITDLERCAGACPAAGGSIQLSGTRGTLDVQFDGSAVATWSHSNGSTGTRPLACGN